MDIAPELIKSIQKEFQEFLRYDPEYVNLLDKIAKNKATYKEAHQLAVRVGDDLAKAYKMKLSSDVLPDGKMYYNIAERLIYDTIKEPQEIVADSCRTVQETINKSAGIGMRAVTPDINTERIDGIIERLSSGEFFDDIEWLLNDPIINLLQSQVDDFVRENAKAQSEAGIDAKIVRKAVGRACKWCQKLVGTYNYEDVSDTGNDVFRRHENCRCTTDYVIDGKRTNVWTKIQY